MKLVRITTVLCLLASPALAQKVVKTMPPVGAIKEGQRIRVDDGTCPAGQIKLVIGGSQVKHIARSEQCVPRK